MDCRVCVAAGDLWVRIGGVGVGGGGGGGVAQIGGGFSHESEHDLALMVSDFLENGSSGADSWCSSDSDSGLSDIVHLAERIPYFKYPMAHDEGDFLSVVHSLTLCIKEMNLNFVKSGPCSASCIKFSLVKLLRLSSYDAAVCSSKWQGSGKVPGGDHEYIDVVNYNNSGTSERLIIDVDFRSHFEIARAVKAYDRILNSLPAIYVGSLTRLKQYLQVMVEAARSSLKQNSMPLPPWRSLAYLQAKWESPYERMLEPEGVQIGKDNYFDHKQCIGHLKRVQSLLQSELGAEKILKPINNDTSWRMKPDRRRNSLFRNYRDVQILPLI